jgi:hypothetical protein
LSHFSQNETVTENPIEHLLGNELLSVMNDAANSPAPISASKQRRNTHSFDNTSDKITPDNCMLIGSANVNSLRGKFEDISARLHTYNYSAFALQETKLHENLLSTDFSVNGYSLFRRDRTNNGESTGWRKKKSLLFSSIFFSLVFRHFYTS